jgi:hypothetical protein
MRGPVLALAVAVGVACAGVVHAQAQKPAAKPAAAAPKYDAAKLKALEAKLAKNPKDAKLKKQTAEASYQVGHAMMLDPNLRPMVKYPGALKHFKRALDLDPKHAKAARDRKMIEDIYRQMGRPIPT